MLRRPLVVLVVIGTAVPIMAVQRITATVLAASMVSFSFAVAIQLAVGAAVVASAGSRGSAFPARSTCGSPGTSMASDPQAARMHIRRGGDCQSDCRGSARSVWSFCQRLERLERLEPLRS